jgi:hypothetical protein
VVDLGVSGGTAQSAGRTKIGVEYAEKRKKCVRWPAVGKKVEKQGKRAGGNLKVHVAKNNIPIFLLVFWSAFLQSSYDRTPRAARAREPAAPNIKSSTRRSFFLSRPDKCVVVATAAAALRANTRGKTQESP